jgi:multidrug efflux pump subunit AcrB
MDITRFAIEHNRITIVVVIVLLLAGAGAYQSLPRAEDPGFTIRTAVVQTLFPGANPERVENLVTDKIEKIVQEMPELDNVRSESKTGLSIVYVDIQENFVQMRPIWDSLRRKVQKAVPDLPEEVIGPFINDEFGDVFGIILAITAGQTIEGAPQIQYAELKDIAYSVRDVLLRLDDVGKVEIYGVQDERVFVEYNNARLAELGLSVVQLQQILQARNIIVPGGSVTTGIERIELEPSGNFDSIEDLRRTVISIPGRSDLLYLEDIAEINRGYIDPPESKMHSSGIPSLGLAISTKEGGNIMRLGEDIKSLIQRLSAEYPIGIDFELVAYQPDIGNRGAPHADHAGIAHRPGGGQSDPFRDADEPVRHVHDQPWSQPDVAGVVDYRPGYAGGQCDRDVRIDHGPDGSGKAAS